VSAKLRRFWFNFDPPQTSRLGYGVTAWTEEDAASLLSSRAVNGVFPSGAKVAVEVDVASLDGGHIRPNMGDGSRKGVWYPLGYDEPT
jgi:hypothetical protein